MDDKEQFTNLVAKHASGLTEEQLAGYDTPGKPRMKA